MTVRQKSSARPFNATLCHQPAKGQQNSRAGVGTHISGPHAARRLLRPQPPQPGHMCRLRPSKTTLAQRGRPTGCAVEGPLFVYSLGVSAWALQTQRMTPRRGTGDCSPGPAPRFPASRRGNPAFWLACPVGTLVASGRQRALPLSRLRWPGPLC